MVGIPVRSPSRPVAHPVDARSGFREDAPGGFASVPIRLAIRMAIRRAIGMAIDGDPGPSRIRLANSGGCSRMRPDAPVATDS